MDPIVLLLLVLVAIVIAAVAFAMVRKKQRSGTVLAAPDHRDGAGS